MRFAQPITVYFDHDPASLPAIQRSLGPRQVRFGGRLPMRVNAPPQHQEFCTIMVQTQEDLRIVNQALAANGRRAWVNVMTGQGPVALPLADFLLQSGLS